MQKKCIRNVASKGHRSQTDPIFSSLNILKFEDLFKYNCSTFMHKYSQNKLPESFHEMFSSMSQPNRTCGYKLDIIKNNSLSQYPIFFLPKIWNQNTLEIKMTKSLNIFKKNLHKSLIEKYPSMAKCQIRSCPDCYPE